MKRKIVSLLLLCVVAVMIVGAMFAHDVFFISPKSDAKPVEVVVEQGDTLNEIDSHLEKAGVIAHPLFFKWFVEFTHTQTKLQAGTFILTPGASIASLVLLLSNVKNVEVQVTIPEGFTNDQIKAKLAEAFANFDAAEWDAQTKDLQGYLFPDTYRFAKNASVNEIVEKMRSTLTRRLIENGVDETQISFDIRPDSRYNFSAVISMASLIEKEVRTPDDMKHVAGVFLNRIAIGMPLQSDTSAFTYKNKGLPPPINNPGMNAILAVLHPTQTNDLYFINMPNGEVLFTQSYAEHVKNRQKYLSTKK